MDATYYISTDACHQHIEADTADEAACEFAASEGIKGIHTAHDLEEYLRRVGGYGFMEDSDGREVFRVRA